ncbi:hypothetical protein BDZ94DRAFT_1162293 [Collybia nuda]|uniref:SH3 domain-containing protein n=1 Tax=Collybia nuda TaxID=64659 RepID=A0A9P6CFM7_9AGAR|nr:hypothetical protein BDZ94DRAFT_1162293 [Collybia nuda]
MVFANLQHHEKEAFFSLLDEYFSSRPEIFAGLSEGASSSSGGGGGAAAASAVHRALASNPEATSQLFSAGLKHGVPKSSPYSAAVSDPEVNNAVGRVAAASLAFSARNHGSGGGGSQPPPPPHRSPPPVAVKPANNLVSSRKFGDVDTSSAKGMFGSIVSSSARKNAPPPGPPPAPAAFGQKKSSFAPPPVRRAVSGASTSDSPPPPVVQRHQQQQEEEQEEEEQEYGEWADVLYDYVSTDPGDLNLKADQRVLVTERTSDDWWTGEVNGKKGLFPASYVKIL